MAKIGLLFFALLLFVCEVASFYWEKIALLRDIQVGIFSLGAYLIFFGLFERKKQ